jgi:heme exporter protein CcmB
MTALATHDDPTRENDTFSPLRFLGTVIRRDMLLAARRRGDWLTSQFFFVMVVSMFPLGIGPEPEVLRMVGPGVVWVAALLASLLSLPRLFAEDFRDGSLEQMLLSPEPTVLVTLGKALAHWCIYGIPLLLITPLLGVQFSLPGEAIGVLVASLLIGTPILSLLGSIGAAPDARFARRRRTVDFADPAPVCSCPDLRRRRCRRGALRRRLFRAPVAARRVPGAHPDGRALGGGLGP